MQRPGLDTAGWFAFEIPMLMLVCVLALGFIVQFLPPADDAAPPQAAPPALLSLPDGT